MMNDYRATLNIVGWVLAAFSSAFIGARMYTRTRISTTLPGWDDWCMLVAYVFAIICTALVTVGTTYGFGQHIMDIKDPEDQANAAMYVLLAPIISIASAFFTKTSIILSLMRIMGRTVTWVHKALAYGPLAILLLASFACWGVMIFFCWPVEKSWRPYLPGSCMDPLVLDVVGRGVSAYNAAMDIFCALIPIFIIKELNIRRKDKRNLIILMGGSIFGAVATIMKIVAMSTISNVADITHSWSEITIWYLAENHVLIVTGSMPALRPFWRAVQGKFSSYRSGSSSYGKDPENQSSNKKSKQSGGSIHMPTIGSMRYNARKGPVPGPYSVELRGDSSEESLERHLRGGAMSPTKGADTESVEVILPKNHGSTKATITSGGAMYHISNQEKPERRSNEDRITVTREYEIK